MEWIRAALSYLQDDASIWASLAMEEFATRGVPFSGRWETFREHFKARFETVDEAVNAKEKLRVLWQDTFMVPKYAALFKELMACTGYSSADLRDRFYKHLSTRIKDELVHTARPISTLDELIMVASDIDVQVCQHCAKRDREKKRSGVGTRMTSTQNLPSNSPFVSLAAEPTAMDVDATRTRNEFMRRMHGKCFGCRSATHSRKDSSHEHNLCAYCKRVRHREVVCMDKFLGKPKGQRAAATIVEGSGKERNSLEEATERSESERAAATTATTLAKLMEQQKALSDQIAALHKLDF